MNQTYSLEKYIENRTQKGSGTSVPWEKNIEEARLAKAIVQIDKECNVIKEYSSILEICQAFNIERGDNIRNVLKGKQKTAYGFSWKYKKDMK